MNNGLIEDMTVCECSQCGKPEKFKISPLTEHEAQMVRIALVELRRHRPEIISQEQLVKLMRQFE
jgi:hypothetical protein